MEILEGATKAGAVTCMVNVECLHGSFDHGLAVGPLSAGVIPILPDCRTGGAGIALWYSLAVRTQHTDPLGVDWRHGCVKVQDHVVALRDPEGHGLLFVVDHGLRI